MTFNSSKSSDTSDKDFVSEYCTIEISCPVDTHKLWCHLRDCGKFESDQHFLTHLLNLQKLWDTGCLKVSSNFEENQQCECEGTNNMAHNDGLNSDVVSSGEMPTYSDYTKHHDDIQEPTALVKIKTEYHPLNMMNKTNENDISQSSNCQTWNLRPRNIDTAYKYKEVLSDSSDFGDELTIVEPQRKYEVEINTVQQYPSLSTNQPTVVSNPLTQEEYEESEMRKRPLRKRLKKIVQSEEEDAKKADEVKPEIKMEEEDDEEEEEDDDEEEDETYEAKGKSGNVKRWSARRIPVAASAYMKVMCIGGRISPDRKATSSTNKLILKSTRLKGNGKKVPEVTSTSSKFDEIKCPICEASIINSRKDLIEHLETEHSQMDEKLSCDICNLKFENNEEFANHLQSHTEKSYTCDKCSMRFSNRHRLNIHHFEHLTDEAKEDFRCDVCGKPCYSKCYLQRHRRRHTGERPYMCDVCGKVYFEMSTLNTHRRSHTGERYTCPLCGNRYMQKSALNLHMKSAHEGIKEHMCEMCGKAFFDKHHLQKHIRIHTGEKPYQCDFCGKSFTQKVNRDQHRRLHTGEQPYRCEYCFRMFALRAAYTQHVRKHTGVKVSEMKKVQLEKLQSELNKKQSGKKQASDNAKGSKKNV